MDERTGQQCRLVCMLILTFLFFLVEIIVGSITKSLALVGDSFHMISDVIALAIGLACLTISTLQSKNNTYGWVRAEVLGALINSVFLMALCFSIFTEAIHRMIQPEEINNPDLLLYVGIAGLAINLVGLLMFCSGGSSHAHSHSADTHDQSHGTKTHGHAHGVDTHGQSHGGDAHGHSHGHSKGKDHSNVNQHALSLSEIEGGVTNEGRVDEHGEDVSITMREEHDEEGQHIGCHALFMDLILYDWTASGAQMNIRGVFLHIMGDALGSVVVIVSAIVIKFAEGDWRYRLDPAMSLGMVIIIMTTTVPLFLQTSRILLQNVPNHIRVTDLANDLTSKVRGVLGVHEMHVWQLAGSRIIASLHVKCQSPEDYVGISKQLKDFFHNAGIHSTTIQPEFVQLEAVPPARECSLECGPDKACFQSTCCSIKPLDASLKHPDGTTRAEDGITRAEDDTNAVVVQMNDMAPVTEGNNSRQERFEF